MTKSSSRLLTSSLMISVLVAFVFVASPKVSSAQRTVVIDPGHGSAVNKRDYEGTRELAIGLKLKANLEQKGYKVVMTHSSIGTAIGGVNSGSSEKQDNIARANIANSSQADLSIRLHSDDRSDDRFVILYPDKQAKDPYGFSGPQNTSIIPKSKAAASAVQNALTKSGYNGSPVGETVGFRNGGMIQTFSAHSSYPGITLELYGHNSSALRNKYAQATEQTKVAKALAEGINAYLGGSGSSPAQSGSSQVAATGERLANADPKCPTQVPNSGPASGSDVQAEVAQSFMHAQNEAAEAASGTDFGSFQTSNPGTVPPSSGPVSEIGKKIVQVAQGELGKKYNDDHTPYQSYSIPGYGKAWAWCVAFVTWTYNKAGANVERTGGTARITEVFPSPHKSISNPSAKGISPMPGDAFVIRSSYSDSGRHAGLVESVSGNTVYTIEGNNSRNSVSRQKHSLSELLWIGRW